MSIASRRPDHLARPVRPACRHPPAPPAGAAPSALAKRRAPVGQPPAGAGWRGSKPLRGALGALYKRRPIVERDRDILKRTNVITTNVHYAVKRLSDRGVCMGTLTA